MNLSLDETFASSMPVFQAQRAASDAADRVLEAMGMGFSRSELPPGSRESLSFISYRLAGPEIAALTLDSAGLADNLTAMTVRLTAQGLTLPRCQALSAWVMQTFGPSVKQAVKEVPLADPLQERFWVGQVEGFGRAIEAAIPSKTQFPPSGKVSLSIRLTANGAQGWLSLPGKTLERALPSGVADTARAVMRMFGVRGLDADYLLYRSTFSTLTFDPQLHEPHSTIQ